MELLVDLFGYLGIIVHGFTNAGQAVALGTVLFLLLLARPLEPELGAVGPQISSLTARVGIWGALVLAGCAGLEVAMQTAVLIGTVDLSLPVALGANSSLGLIVKITAAVLLAGLFRQRGAEAGTVTMLVLGAIILAAAMLTTHAVARLGDRAVLTAVSALHQLGAAIWLGGLPCFLLALRAARGSGHWLLIGKRYSSMSMLGVGAILGSGLLLSLDYIGSWQGLYGAAYGVMVASKGMLLLLLLGLGAGNFLLIERLRRDPATPILRLRRFVEVEIGLGLIVMLAAASLTSVAPAVDVPSDQASWQEIQARYAPRWPRIASPDPAALALLARQGVKFVPGAGIVPPRNKADEAWSEYNHHWAGMFVALIGLLALLERAGLRHARHWPLVFLGLAGFLLLRSDPEVWPTGPIGILESLRDVEVLQHRVAALLVVVFGIFEWRVRAGGLQGTRAADVFPMICVIGGALLLTHNHQVADAKDALLIELSHTPVALLGIVAGWARWLELRLEPPISRIAGWIWPAALLLVGVTLLGYWESP